MKYDALTQWLLQQTGQIVTVTFQLVERIIGQPLPTSARKHRPWWGNETNARGRQCGAWQKAGYHVQSVDLQNGVVVFAR
jgi:hypothetical protein